VRFNREALPAEILRAVRDKFGSEDAPDAWQLVAEAVRPYIERDNTLVLPCLTLCFRAVGPSAPNSQLSTRFVIATLRSRRT
jgi:hypothetical protein